MLKMVPSILLKLPHNSMLTSPPASRGNALEEEKISQKIKKKTLDKRREISNECKNVQGLSESSFLYERNSGNSSYLH